MACSECLKKFHIEKIKSRTSANKCLFDLKILQVIASPENVSTTLYQNKSCHLQFCGCYNKTSKFKVWKFVHLIIFYSESIFRVIRVSNCCVCQDTLPAFLDKGVFRYHFCVSQKEAWKSKKAAAASTRCPSVKEISKTS